MTGKAIMTVGSALLRYDEMCREIATFLTIEEVLKFANLADLLRLKAKQALNRETELLAIELRLRAERRCGQIILGLYEHGGIRRGFASGPKDKRIRLSDFGIKNEHKNKFIRYARMTERQFEDDIFKWREECQKQQKIRSFPHIPTDPRFYAWKKEDYSLPSKCSLMGWLGEMNLIQAGNARQVLDLIIKHAGAAPGHQTISEILSEKQLGEILYKCGYSLDQSENRWRWRPSKLTTRDRPEPQSEIRL